MRINSQQKIRSNFSAFLSILQQFYQKINYALIFIARHEITRHDAQRVIFSNRHKMSNHYLLQ